MSPTRLAEGAALALAAAAGLVVTLVPLGSEVSESITSTGQVTLDEHTTRLVDDVGTGGVTAIVVAPLVLTLLPLLVGGPTHRVVTSIAAGLLGVANLLALLSVGMLYLPATGALVVAAVLSWALPRPATPPPTPSAQPSRRP